MQLATCFFVVLMAATLFQGDAAVEPPTWVDNYNLERELGIVGLEIAPVADIDLLKLIQLLLFAKADILSCNENTVECQIVLVAYKLMVLIQLDPNDVITEVAKILIGA